MDHFEGIVLEYLRANRSTFVNSQFCIQLNEGKNPDVSGPHWYCDAVAVNFVNKTVYLCEVTYAARPATLMKRLSSWNKNWEYICAAVRRDASIPEDWSILPRLFVQEIAKDRLAAFAANLEPKAMPQPLIESLEEILPWKYCSWDRPEPGRLPGDPISAN